MTQHPPQQKPFDPHEHGPYVVPFDIPNGPPRGFLFDGDSGVADLNDEVAAKHDWDYLTGRMKFTADLAYLWGYIRDQRPARGLLRFLGLTIGGHGSYHRHRKDRHEHGTTAMILSRIHPAATDPQAWLWPYRTWLVDDLKPV